MKIRKRATIEEIDAKGLVPEWATRIAESCRENIDDIRSAIHKWNGGSFNGAVPPSKEVTPNLLEKLIGIKQKTGLPWMSFGDALGHISTNAFLLSGHRSFVAPKLYSILSSKGTFDNAINETQFPMKETKERWEKVKNLSIEGCFAYVRNYMKQLKKITPVPPPVPKKGTIDPKLGTLDLKTSTPKPYGDPDYGKEYDPEDEDIPF